MLVMCMREDDKVIIGDPKNPVCIIHLVKIRGERIKLGFEADRATTPIHREAIANRIIQNQGGSEC